jgi:hypothetical protein
VEALVQYLPTTILVRLEFLNLLLVNRGSPMVVTLAHQQPHFYLVVVVEQPQLEGQVEQ